MKVARIGLVAFALVLLAGACWLLAVPDPPRIASRDESLVTAPPKSERGAAVVAAEPEPTGFDERESIAGEEVAESPAASSPPAPSHPTTSLLGTVVDAVTRAPRRGQRVELGCPVIADFDPVTAVSDDRGEFRAKGLPIRRTLFARFEMECGERWIQRFELRESGESRRTFEIATAESVTGRVVDAVSWYPIAGATVRIEYLEAIQRGGVEAQCVSAADGSFALAIPAGTMREDGIVEIEVPPGTFDLELSQDPRRRTNVKISLVANPDPRPVTVRVPRPRLGTVVVERVEDGLPDGEASEADDVLEVTGATLHFAGGDNVFWAAAGHEQRKVSATETEYRLPAGRLEIAFGNALLLPNSGARRVIELEEHGIVRIRIRLRAPQ
jgi:hypothetical protein